MVVSAASLRPRRHRRPSALPTPVDGGRPAVVMLSDATALDPSLVGAKAANLARSAGRHLPVLDGFVLTTIACAGDPLRLRELRDAYEQLSQGGARRVVVRSSSPVEDGEHSSMAGRFVSVLDVAGWDQFSRAVLEVIDSGRTVALQDGRVTVEMAVLVQPQLDAVAGGVLFGADPVTGRTDRLSVAAVTGGPDKLVSGETDGARLTLSRRGRLVEVEGDERAAELLTRTRRRRLAALARSTAAVFGGPQDNEWAIDGSGRLWLLQSRPITALAAQTSGAVLGPGPLAETFPDPLSPLEQDLWLDPLREAIAVAVGLTGAVSKKRLAGSPVALAVGGRAAVDLELVGAVEQAKSFFAKLDPRPPARRLRAAWRTGRLRSALPALASDLVERTDSELRSVGDLSGRTDEQLIDLLAGCRRALVALHGQEILAGLLLPERADGGAASGAAVALRTLVALRDSGVGDADIVAGHPVVLALVPPAIRPATLPPPLAAMPSAMQSPQHGLEDDAEGARERLRLRVRYVHELSALVAWELGRRAVPATPELVRWMTLAELGRTLAGGLPPVDLQARSREPWSAPLPSTFRLADDGTPVAVRVPRREGDGGQGAGGGRGMGPVVHAADGVPAPGSVLVTTTLDPGLAALLPGLGGLVAETGSVLSHLAILARELGVPTVVGMAGAVEQLPEGATVIVDGTSGEVRPA